MTRHLLPLLSLFLITLEPGAAWGDDSTQTAKALAGRLSSAQMGESYVRLMMAVKARPGSPGGALQLQIKQRRTPARADILYQVLWPKERKGEAVLLHQNAGSAPAVMVYLPPNDPRKLSPGQGGESLFGGDLTYQDAIENFFDWGNQGLAGSESVNGIDCVIVESKPGGADHSIYGSVRSWIDTRRLVPLRVEKYFPSGRLARRIDTTRVATDDEGRPIPADLSVHATGDDSETDLNGSRIRHDITYSDSDFTVAAMKKLSPPQSGSR